MQLAQAKDFLVRQTAEQALLEDVPLSGLEKRMMYFTEGEDSSEDSSKLDDEFETNFDSAAYEAKVSKLLNQAYFRLKRENPETARRWDGCIRLLSKRDHYIVVLCGQRFSTERPPHDSWKLFGTAILVIVVGGIVMLGFVTISEHFALHWPNGPKSQTSLPGWIQRPIQWAFFDNSRWRVPLLCVFALDLGAVTSWIRQINSMDTIKALENPSLELSNSH